MFIRRVDRKDTNADAAVQSRAVGPIRAALMSEAALLFAAKRISSPVQFPISTAAESTAPKIARATTAGKTAVKDTVSLGSLLMMIESLIGVVGTAMTARAVCIGTKRSDCFADPFGSDPRICFNQRLRPRADNSQPHRPRGDCLKPRLVVEECSLYSCIIRCIWNKEWVDSRFTHKLKAEMMLSSRHPTGQ